MSYRYRQEYVARIHELAIRSLARHAIIRRHDHGAVQGWYVRDSAGGSSYWFEVWTGPGWLMIRGDLGAMVWEREQDMLAWVRKAIDDVDYLAQKATSGDSSDAHGTRDEWNKEAAIASLVEAAWEEKDRAWERGHGDGCGPHDRDPHEQDYRDAKGLLELANATRQGEGDTGPIGDHWSLYCEAAEQGLDGFFQDGNISCWNWNSQYLWRRECLIKLLSLLDNETRGHSAKPDDSSGAGESATSRAKSEPDATPKASASTIKPGPA